MKRIKLYTLAAAFMALTAVPANAQTALRSGYYLEGYSYRHQLNPAFAPDRAYVSMPVLGNINIGMQGNVGVSSFLYPMPGSDKLTTFMNSSVDGHAFLKDLKERNRINMDINMNLVSVGFQAWGGFNTVELNLRSGVRANLPYDLFAFMKMGMSSSETHYSFENLGLSTTNYVELALGHSRQITDKWRVGAKMKFLIGAADAYVDIKKMDITMSQAQWKIDAEGEMNLAAKGLLLPTKAEANPDRIYGANEADLVEWDEMDYDSPGLTGFGMAFDLGATYQLRPDLQLSAALVDLGGLRWKNNIKATTDAEPWMFDGFHNIATDNSETGNPKLDDEFERIGDELEELTNFHRREQSGKRGRWLGATLNLGALYTLPYYDKLKFGFLSSTRINGRYSWSEGRFSANVAPVKCFDAGINYAISSFGSSFGWVLNFHTKGFGMFLGADHQVFKCTPQFLPVNKANMNLSLGINFPMGTVDKN